MYYMAYTLFKYSQESDVGDMTSNISPRACP